MCTSQKQRKATESTNYSLAGGASLDRPAEMSAFSFIGKGLSGCNFPLFEQGIYPPISTIE